MLDKIKIFNESYLSVTFALSLCSGMVAYRILYEVCFLEEISIFTYWGPYITGVIITMLMLKMFKLACDKCDEEINQEVIKNDRGI